MANENETKEAEPVVNHESDGDLAVFIGHAMHSLIAPLQEKRPDLGFAGVIKTARGEVMIVAHKDPTMNREQLLERIGAAKVMFRNAATEAGRRLFENPLNASAYHEEVEQITGGSLERFKEYVGKNMRPDERVTEAATLIATAVRLLDSLNVPREATHELMQVAKEACRRGHLRVLEMSAAGSA